MPVRLTLAVSDDLKVKVDKSARANRRTVTAEINMLIEEALDARERKGRKP
jgi:predicted transcriptional regulator